MSRNTKQTDLARQILDTLPNGLGNASKNLKVYVGLRDRMSAIAEEIEALKQEEIVDTKKIATLETEKADLKHEFNSYGQKLKAAGIDLGACDEEMDRQAFIADNIKLIKEVVDAHGKGKPDPNSRIKQQKRAYKKSLFSKTCLPSLSYLGLPNDPKKVREMIHDIEKRQKDAQKAKKSYRCRDEAKKSLKAGYKAASIVEEAEVLLETEEGGEKTTGPNQNPEPSTTAQTQCYDPSNDIDEMNYWAHAFGIA